MLVLSREKNEEIYVHVPDSNGKDGYRRISFMLVGVRGEKARIGIEADPDILIYRKEIYEEINRNRKTFNQYLSDKDWNKAYAMLIDQKYRPERKDLNNLSNVMGVSVGALEASLEYKI